MKYMIWVACVAALVVAGVMLDDLPARAQAAPATTNGTVSFKVNCGSDIIDQEIRATVTVEKPGKPPLVNATPPAAGEIDGNHNFPAGTTAAAVGAYYEGVLANAGWVPGTDFKVKGGTISFFGISKIDAGTSHKHLVASGTSDSKDVEYENVVPAPLKKTLKMIRGGETQDGSIRLLGFGIDWHGDHLITTSTSQVNVFFLATDTASDVIGKIRDALLGAGWDVMVDPSGQLVMTSNGEGAPLYSIHQEIEYIATEGHETNDDHWVYSIRDDE